MNYDRAGSECPTCRGTMIGSVTGRGGDGYEPCPDCMDETGWPTGRNRDLLCSNCGETCTKHWDPTTRTLTCANANDAA